MVLEPLNRLTDHPHAFLTHIHQAYELVAVDSPACKILFDLYHQQITEGNIIPNIDRHGSTSRTSRQATIPAAGRQPPGR